MNKYQEAILEIKKMNCNITKDWNCEICTHQKVCAYYLPCKTLQEAVDKANKYDEKETTKPKSKKPKGLSICPDCNNGLYINQKYCDKCGQALDWGDE